MWLYFKPKYVEKGRERRKTKIIVPFRSYPTRNRKFIKQLQKKSKKTDNYSYGFFLSKNWLETAEKDRKYKLSFRFVPSQCVIEKSKKIAKKLKKL